MGVVREIETPNVRIRKRLRCVYSPSGPAAYLKGCTVLRRGGRRGGTASFMLSGSYKEG